MLSRAHQRGDTLIEVLFAVTVFSLVVVGALSVMNQGTAASQRALEITLVRQQMDAQAETLRFLHDSYVAAYQPGLTYNTSDASTSPAEEWYRIMSYVSASGITSATAFAEQQRCASTAPTGSFIVNPRIGQAMAPVSYQPAAIWPQLDYNGLGVMTGSSGMWVEAVRSGASSDPDQARAGYVDFHIRACWDAPGLSNSMNLGTIVRLYEPR